MDDIYTNLENYDDFNKLEELKNENKTLKYKLEEYTSAINKLQKDFDMLTVEHNKLELNYSSLLKTAKAEIERKTHMIKELNIEKDKLIINARQSNYKTKFNKFQSDTFNSKCNKGSDTSSIQEQQQTPNPTSQASHTYKNINSSPLDTTSTCSGDTRDLHEVASSATKNVKNDSINDISKEKFILPTNNLSDRQSETKVKRIVNRRKSLPASSYRDVIYSSGDERDSGVTNKRNKIQYPSRDEINESADRYYKNHKTYEISNFEDNYTQYQESAVSNYSRNKQYYSDNNYRSRDSYDSSQRRRRNISPDRSNHRSRRDYTDNYYQTYHRRGYESPPRDKPYHQSRSGEHRYNYNRDRSRDYLRSNNDNDRHVEKHRLQDDPEEPTYKRQKYEHSHRNFDDDGWQRESSASKAALPVLLEMSSSCQSPDYVHPDNHISTAPVREIRSIAVMPLEDPRLSSKKYNIITDCNKEILTTVIGRNIDITPVNKKLWGFSPIPVPKALIEPPSSYTDNVHKSFNMDIGYPTNNMYVDSHEMSNRTANDKHCLRNNSTDLTSNTNSKDVVLSDITAPEYKETLEKYTAEISQTTDGKKSASQAVKEQNDNKVSDKQLRSGYKIPKKQISSEFSKSTENLNNKILNLDPEETPCIHRQEISQPTIDSKCPTLSDSIKSKTIDKENYSLQKSQTQDEDAENVENTNHNLDMAKKIVEFDLTLSDDTSDNFEPELTIVEPPTKTKCKKNKTLTQECSEKHKSTKEPKKSLESGSKTLLSANTVEDREKRLPEKVKNKCKGESIEHSKKQRHKKKSQEGKDCDVDDSKPSKIKKANKEKETKTIELKTKFSELFGTSNSLITCEDLGVVDRESEFPTDFDSIIEDGQDAVDINIKEIEKLQASKLKPYIAQNGSMEGPVDRQTALTDSTMDNSSNRNKKSDDLKISIRRTEDKYSIVHEAASRVFNKTMISEVSNIPKTTTITTGEQPQNTFKNDVEFRQPLQVTPIEKVVQPFLSPGEALATSTPAKQTLQDHSQKDSLSTQSDCSSNSTDAKMMDSSQTKNQMSDTESKKDSDVPDVRIFLKRRRKVKK